MRKTCSVAGTVLFVAMCSMASYAQDPSGVVFDLDRVIEILHGQRAVTGDTARRLGHYFGTSTEFWMNLQQLYELRRRGAHGGEVAAVVLGVSSFCPMFGGGGAPGSRAALGFGFST